MAGFANDTVYGNNADFSVAASTKGSISNGLLTNGQMWIGTTATNVGGTHINVGTLTSPLGTITIGYSSPNITLEVAGGAAAIEKINLQAGTSPIVPSGGIITFNGATVAAGTNPVRTDGTGANTMALQVQISQALAATDATKIGLCNFNSTHFTVDANGFVALSGTGPGLTITGNAGGALSPTAGNWNILGASTAAGTSPVTTSGAASTLTVNVQKSQAIASTDATKIGLAAFDSADFTVDANGFVSASTTGFLKTLTGNSGGAIAPVANNINTVGTGSITIAGAGSTLTTQLTGLTNHNVLVGAGTATITNVAPSATSGVPLISQGAAADPAFGTAVVAGGGTGATSFNINGVVISNTATTTPLAALTLTNGQVVIGSTGNPPAAATLTAGTGISITNAANSITIASTGGSGFTSVNIQTFTGSGTYTPTAGMLYCIVEMVGGGGGGAGAGATGGNQASIGGGGGGGEYARGVFSAATIGASKTVTIGAAGTAGVAGGNGGTGGTTSLSTLLTAVGGSGGITGGPGSNGAASNGGAGGTGGTGSGTYFHGVGGTGTASYTTGGVGSIGFSGSGGASAFGGGGAPLNSFGAGNAPGAGFGGGGGGALQVASQGGQPGGAGAAGFVVITEYI